jgi:hypothetical protein
MNEAWRIFCKSRYKFSEHYECRGTDLQRSQKLVMMQNFNNGQMRESGFIPLHFPVLGAGTECKNRDKYIYFIVRVMCWQDFKVFIFVWPYYLKLL